MKEAIKLSKNDAGVILSFYCRNEEGKPIDLTMKSVDFFLYDDTTLINEGHTTCTKPDAAFGVAEYTITGEDTASSGIFQGKLCLQAGISEIRNIGNIPIVIQE